MIDVVCFIQARSDSTRLPGKMLLTLEGKTLLERAWEQAVRVFGIANVYIVFPFSDIKIYDEVERICALGYAWDGPTNDVLSRFWHAAKSLKLASDTKICRITPDDWRKDDQLIREVVRGRMCWPVEQSAEVFTMEQLDEWYWSVQPEGREHIGNMLLETLGTPPDDGLPWSIDTQDDYDRVVAAVGK